MCDRDTALSWGWHGDLGATFSSPRRPPTLAPRHIPSFTCSCPRVTAITRYRRCLDLGCGTGLSGQAASSVCGNLVGVDLSPAMVGRAKDKRLYRRLLVGDVTETVERLCRESEERPPAGDGDAGTRRPRGWEVPAAAEEEGGSAAAAAAATAAVAGDDDEGGALRNAAPTPAPAVEEGSSSPEPALGRVARPPHSVASGSSRIASGIGGPAERGELVISCDVFVYIGNLRPCFKAVNNLVTGRSSSMAEPQEPGAIFAFSAEAPPPAAKTTSTKDGGAGSGPAAEGSQPGYELQGTGRWVPRFRWCWRCSSSNGKCLATGSTAAGTCLPAFKPFLVGNAIGPRPRCCILKG